MTDIDKLKPCPCCKSTKLRANEGFDECDNLECWIECEECSFASEPKDSAQDAQREWNTNIAQEFRSTISAQQKRIEELEKALEPFQGFYHSYITTEHPHRNAVLFYGSGYYLCCDHFKEADKALTNNGGSDNG